MASDGETRLQRNGAVARITFDRPAARNAMTWQMYEQLGVICAALKDDRGIRVAVFRGAGGKAFIAGTDIAQFQEFRSGEDGLAYEARMEKVLSAIEALPMPTLAVVEGFAVGGGLAISACCDLRIATPDARFGVPIARTLGNCLSIENYARLIAGFGAARAKRVLLLAENIAADEALAAGFVSAIVEPAALDGAVEGMCARLQNHAPVTMRVSKEAIRRILHAGLPNGDDLVRACYASEDFHTGVRAFIAKAKPEWRGN